MRLESYIDLKGIRGISGLFAACGSFGIIDAGVQYTRTDNGNVSVFEYASDKIKLSAEFTFFENGAVIRRDTLENLTDEPIEINRLSSRFRLDGNEYDVYTQYNGWLHESQGAWERLNTRVVAAGGGIRTCEGAAPIMALSNRYTGRCTVFHLLPNCEWKITAKKYPVMEKELVVIEAGFEDSGLKLMAEPHEVIELPRIIFFSAKSKVDLDAYKLHEVYNTLYPRRTLPIIYNSWLYCFDRLDIDDLFKQIDTAADMGIEAFMIDAGWFGNGANWAGCVGDWSENMTSGPAGRLIDISNRVRERGMIFGLWFEPERAGWQSEAIKNHPEQYMYGWALDFANNDARNRMLEVISEQIRKYNIGWVKFDFNECMPYDPRNSAFYRYLKGQREFIVKLRERFPELYITNCASGGQRMDLGCADIFDSYWLSDNQGPDEGIRIVKDTLKRMPTSLIERWNVQTYCEGFPQYEGGKVGKMLNCNDGVWSYIIGTHDSFPEEFVKGGPLGMSCDLASFPEKYKTRWKEVITDYKQNREFYRTATARILVETDAMTVIQYSDKDFDKCVLQIFMKKVYAKDIILFPKVDENAYYDYGGAILHGSEIAEDGIYTDMVFPHTCVVLNLQKKSEVTL